MKTARLTKKEDEFWEEVYNCVIRKLPIKEYNFIAINKLC